MCGRFLLESEVEDLVARYNAEYSIEEFKYGEIFPSEKALTVIKSKDKITLKPMKWGFPMKDSKRLIINGRAETVDKKYMFKESLEARRCLIPANAFFEWKAGPSKKIKHRINKNSEKIFSMGGIYNMDSFVILTMDSIDKMKDIHNRMPLILTKEEENEWLDIDTSFSKIKSILSGIRHVDYIIKPEANENTLLDLL